MGVSRFDTSGSVSATTPATCFPKRGQSPVKLPTSSIHTSTPARLPPAPTHTLAAIQKLPAGRWVNLPGQSFKVYYVVEPHKFLPVIVNLVKLRYIRPDRSGYLTKTELDRAHGFPTE